jgi:hypothetical protein
MTGSFAIASYAIASGSTQSVSTPGVIVPITVGVSSCYGYTTAGDLISRALKLILVEAGDSPLQPDEYADGIDILNSYMAGLESDGLRLGYNRVCNVSDIVNVPDGAMRGIAANLAMDLAPTFGGKVTGALVKQAADGLKTLYRMGVKVGETQYPGTLPYPSNYYRVRALRTGPYAAMSMAGNRRLTDITTASVAQKVNGFWTVEAFHGLTPDLSGRITNRGEGLTVDVYAEFNLKASGSTAGGVIAITRNGAIELFVEDIALSTTPVSALITGSIAMEAGDYLEVVVADTASTRDITVIDSVVRLN